MPRKDLVTYPKKVSYRKHPGMVAWLLHRVTGVIAGLFLILHILGFGTVESFAAVAQTGVIKVVFLFAFSFHAFNGVRIVLMEFGKGYLRENSSKYFMAALFIAIVITVIGAIPIFTA